MNVYEVIEGPLITEKSTDLKDDHRTLCFRVAPSATKTEIRKAVEQLFSVKVASVRTAAMKGKVKRYGRFEGKRPSWKKAYVTLRAGEKMIEFFEGV
ncbi:MAG: 50S ribosomal protein L23 [Acidobacteriota bacterium]